MAWADDYWQEDECSGRCEEVCILDPTFPPEDEE